jgi:cyclopropane-fatty-acyl-phospholipid synthase
VQAATETDAATGVAPRLSAAFGRLFGAELPVRLRAWDGSTAGEQDGPTVVLRSSLAIRQLLWQPGELGLARAYVSGELEVDGDIRDGLKRCWAAFGQRAGRFRLSPASFVRLISLAASLGVLGARPAPPPQEARLGGRLHAKSRDRAAIAHHYDLGNSFYELILDPQMAYSCGYWRRDDPDYQLVDAQRDKLDLICEKLQLRAGQRLLDVGCGWGSLILHAVRHYGVHATGITLSAAQRAHVLAKVDALGLTDRVEVRLQDYRELAVAADGPFDAVASIEMGEHVGERNYAIYSAALHRMLRPGGRLLLQQMSRGGVAPGGGAFIESYIAPDMTMRPLHQTLGYLQRAGLEIRQVEALREHYVRTIDAWAQTLEQRWDEAVELVGLGWARVWRLYLAGGALAFEENRMGVDQILATR